MSKFKYSNICPAGEWGGRGGGGLQRPQTSRLHRSFLLASLVIISQILPQHDPSDTLS